MVQWCDAKGAKLHYEWVAKNEKEPSDNEDMYHDGDDGYQSQKESDGYMSDGVWNENDGKEVSYMNCTD